MSSIEQISIRHISHRQCPRHGHTTRRSLKWAVVLSVSLMLAATACSNSDPSAETDGLPASAVTSETVGSSEIATDSSTTSIKDATPESPAGDDVADLEWAQAGLSGETFSATVHATDSGFVAYDPEVQSEAFVSEDGTNWATTDLDLAATGDEVSFYRMTPGRPEYFAFGLVNDEVMWTSEDGLSWIKHDLDLEYPDLGVFHSVEPQSVVVGNDGLVLVGRMDRESPDEHRFFVWTSDDGSAWKLIEDAFPDGARIGEILPTTNGFVTQGFIDGPDGGEFFWTSEDGESWHGFDTDNIDPELTGLAQRGLAVRGDMLLAAGTTADGVRVWLSADGESWEQLPASPALINDEEFTVNLDEIVAGPLGIVLLGELERGAQTEPPLVMEKGDLILTLDFASPSGHLTVAHASSGVVFIDTGLEDVIEGNVDGVAFSDDFGSITVVHPDTGDQVTFAEDDFEEGRTKANQAAGYDPDAEGEALVTRVLWFSPDGQSWTLLKLEETFGTNSLPDEGGVVVGRDAVILRWFEFPQRDDESSGETATTVDDHAEDDGTHGVDLIWVGRPAAGY